MGCAGCSTSTDNGTPKGCKSNGHCKTGGCNQMNTYDWLQDMPIAFGQEDHRFYEVSFDNGRRKGFYSNDNNLEVQTGELVVVDTSMGYDIGRISLSGELVKLQMRKKKIREKSEDIRSINRKPEEKELEKWDAAKKLERDTMIRARAIARSLKLDMKIGHVEFQADRKKATFYYIADDRVDFRELIRSYAREFKVKVEMRQIGARQEAGKIGGIGSCGRELCCSTWLTDFKSVSTSAARYQNLSINLTKLSGQCGRLKCCLNYELDTYMDALEGFPKNVDKLKTEAGIAVLQKTDILKGLMWYTYEKEGFSTFYSLTKEQAAEIKEMNKDGKTPASLSEFAYIENEEQEEEPDFVDTVGQISLAALEKTDRKKRNKNRRNRNQQKNKGQGGNRNKKGGGNQQQSKSGGGENQQKKSGNQQQKQGGKKPNNPNRNRNKNRNRNENRNQEGK